MFWKYSANDSYPLARELSKLHILLSVLSLPKAKFTIFIIFSNNDKSFELKKFWPRSLLNLEVLFLGVSVFDQDWKVLAYFWNTWGQWLTNWYIQTNNNNNNIHSFVMIYIFT